MLENSVVRNLSREEHLVLLIKRLTSSRSTDAGWCFVACCRTMQADMQHTEMKGHPLKPRAHQSQEDLMVSMFLSSSECVLSSKQTCYGQ